MEKEEAKVAEMGQEGKIGVSMPGNNGAQAWWALEASMRTGFNSERAKIYCGVWSRGRMCEE